KIQWLVRPYFEQASYVQIVRTEHQQSVDGTTVPLKVIGKKRKVKGLHRNVSSNSGFLRWLLFHKWLNRQKND
ncbi:MAG: hypothetical protein AAFQ98_26430, partial [Bacteroidota bacterium]